ncbi:hypothetical protein MNBD_GAMMA06-1529 [hydrothermal vent metagenome]|uniref:Antitoxin Xre/MbcA/ParS-like toxin-binding domain-containing protein n=1 Tax=hydrothermal vent metagenome TaxID=652676 RepID=A0A3B0WR87_9ZZZZ
MVFKINNPFESERKITQSAIQVTELLGMYNAELARVLGLQCNDISELTSGKNCIKKDSAIWYQAALFIKTYHLLFDYFEGDSVAMYHWMRADNKYLKGTPHFLIVDESKLQVVYNYLQQVNQVKN